MRDPTVPDPGARSAHAGPARAPALALALVLAWACATAQKPPGAEAGAPLPPAARAEARAPEAAPAAAPAAPSSEPRLAAAPPAAAALPAAPPAVAAPAASPPASAAPPAARACSPYPSEPGESLVATGGELDLGCLPPTTVERRGSELVAWGLSEVPGNSRLQAALAVAVAGARAELLAAVRVGIASLFRSTSSSGPQGDSATAERVTVQVAAGVLPALAPPQHGWRKVKRGSEQVLIVAARLVAERAAVEAAVEKALAGQGAPDELARRAIEGLGPGRAVAPARGR